MRFDLAPVGGMVLLLAVVTVHSLDVEASSDDVTEMVKPCESCHGENGLPQDSTIPVIAGQEFYYLYVQLKDYKSGLRSNPIMSGIAQGLTKEQMQAVAQYFAEREWPSTGYRAPDDIETEAQRGLTAGQCFQCHLGGYEGDSRNPRLAGQQRDYLERTMLEFKNKIRLNSPAKGTLFSSYEDERIAAMAKYLGGL